MPISFFGKRFFRAYIRARIPRVRTGRTVCRIINAV